MRYFSADKIHDGFQFLPHNTVIVLNENGTITDITGFDNIPQEKLQHFTGILCPGFVNTHCHIELSHLKGRIPKHTGLVDFVKQIPSIRNAFDKTAINEAALKAIATMKENGIIAVGDIANHTDTLYLRESSDLHIHTFVECIGFNEKNAANNFAHSYEILQQFSNNNKSTTGKILKQSIVPHAPYSVSKKLLSLINNNQSKTVLSIHNQETAPETEYFVSKTGKLKDLYKHLNIDDSNFEASGKSSLQSILPYLKRNNSHILVHNTFTLKEDIEALLHANLDAHFCLCPNANLYIENRLPDISLLMQSDIEICLGTDSLSSNDTLNIVAEMMSIKSAFPQITLELLIQWATINGAKALQLDAEIGSFAIGKTPGVNWLKEDYSVKRIV